MLTKVHRLTFEKDFIRAYKSGKSFGSEHLRLISLRTNQNNFRFGFVVSKKHAVRIVDRNRIKRILRAETSKYIAQIALGYDIVIQARPGVKNTSAQRIREELRDLLQKSKVLQ